MRSLCQLNERWADNTLGHSGMSIGRWGCTTTSICMIISKFTSDFPLPNEAARRFKYVPNGPTRGSIYWSSDFAPLEFVKRGYWNNRQEIAKYANGKKTGVIISVNNNAHWVAVAKVENGIVWIYDPINFNGIEKLPARYKISGYALFKSTIEIQEDVLNDSEISEYAKHSVDKAKGLGVAKYWDTPHRPIDPVEARIIFHRLGVVKVNDGTPLSKQDFIVAMDRLEALNAEKIQSNKEKYGI